MAEEIGGCLESPQGTPSDLQGAYSALNLWYPHASGKQPHPSRTYIEKVLGEYAVLYQREDPYLPGQPVPTHVIPFYIDDKTPTDEKIEGAVRQMRRNRSGGHIHLRAKQLDRVQASLRNKSSI